MNRYEIMWSIGIYTGKSLFDLAPPDGVVNPVLTHRDVDDVSAAFVADPFMISVSGSWYMFFEVFNRETSKGEIGLAVSKDGFDWKYKQIILSESFHLSYPYVFEFDNDYYLIPETINARSVRLYKASSFPTSWSYVCSLIEERSADSSIFYFDNKWWLFTCPTLYQNYRLCLYFAESLTGPWKEHPASPVVEQNKRIARPAGRVVIFNDKIVRFAQDCAPFYGMQVRAFEVSELTAETYIEREHESSPILTPSGKGWNKWKMHHIDPHLLPNREWIACVDGYNKLQ